VVEIESVGTLSNPVAAATSETFAWLTTDPIRVAP
jgi:hypothetical protein